MATATVSDLSPVIPSPGCFSCLMVSFLKLPRFALNILCSRCGGRSGVEFKSPGVPSPRPPAHSGGGNEEGPPPLELGTLALTRAVAGRGFY